MRCLLVVAHPLKDSLVSTLAGCAADSLRKSGHELRIENLYGAAFAPALTKQERQTYYSGFDASAVTDEVANLVWAEVLVLVFPTWWFGFPAILKGWFDRIWAPGVAYDHAEDLGPMVPRLPNLKKAVAITTLGSPWWVDWLVLRRPVRRVLKTAILGPCAPQCRLEFLSFYGCEKLPPGKVEAAIEHVVRVLSRI